MIAALTPAAAESAIAAGALPLDLRDPGSFAGGHVPGAVNVVFSRQGLGQRVAAVLPPGDGGPALLLIGPDGAAPAPVWQGIAAELSAAGFPPLAGYLEGGTAAWAASGRALASLALLSHAALADSAAPPAVLDVREPSEWGAGIIAGAHRLALSALPAALAAGSLPDLDPARPVAVVCAGGVRSSTAASLLARHGYRQVANLFEGMNGWYGQGRPIARGS